MVGVLAVSVRATEAGALDRTLVAALALGTMAVFEAVAPLPVAALRLEGVAASGRRVLEVTRRPPTVIEPETGMPLGSDPTLCLEQVGFDHAGEETWGLRDVDLRLAPGRRVALVGPSGSGKSTVASLMVRFFDPDAGRVTLGGADLRDLLQRDCRRSVVSLDGQDAYLFSTTIRENVRLAKPDADDREIRRRSVGPGRGDGSAHSPTGSTPSSGRRGRRSPAASGGASPWPGPSWPGPPSWFSTNPRPTSIGPPPRR